MSHCDYCFGNKCNPCRENNPEPKKIKLEKCYLRDDEGCDSDDCLLSGCGYYKIFIENNQLKNKISNIIKDIETDSKKICNVEINYYLLRLRNLVGE